MPPEKVKVELEECSCCGEEFLESKMVDTLYDGQVCKTCADEHYTECSDCGELVETNSDRLLHTHGDDICEECYDNDYFTCPDCDEIFHNDDAREGSDGESYCRDCWSETFTTCCGCDEVIDRDNAMHSHGGDPYCEDCYGEHFGECDTCGESCYRDDLYYDEDADQYLCPNCYEGGLVNGRRVIHDYSYKPSPNFAKLAFENTLYMGFEWEVEIDHSQERDKAKALMTWMQDKKIDKHFYMKHDGSISGFELVSHPTTLGFYHKTLKLKEIAEWFKENGFKSYEGGRCGFHVHISKNFFTKRDLSKLRMFFSIHQSQLTKFSCRRGKGNSFCQYERPDYEDVLDEPTYQDGRYWACNMTPRATVEFRLFRGTLNYERILASLQFCDAVAHYITEVGTSHIIVNSTWKDFMNWCRWKNRYGHFVKFATKLGLG